MNDKNFEAILQKIASFDFPETFDTIVAIANGGIIPAALLNQRLQCDFQVVKISLRDSCQRPMYDAPRLVEPLTFEPKGHRILLVEDRVKTGASLRYAKELLAEAALLKTFSVNGNTDYYLYNENCFRFPWLL